MTVAEKLPDLGHFSGTEGYYRHRVLGQISVLLTDGAKYVAENAGAWWLMDLAAISGRQWLLEGDGFATLTITATEQGTATIKVTDGNENVIEEQHIEFTDFPEGSVTFFLSPHLDEFVFYLRSEY